MKSGQFVYFFDVRTKKTENILQNKSLASKGVVFFCFFPAFGDGFCFNNPSTAWLPPGRVMNLPGLVCIFQVGKNSGKTWVAASAAGGFWSDLTHWQDCIDPVPIPLGYKKEEINNTEDGVKGAEGPWGRQQTHLWIQGMRQDFLQHDMRPTHLED